MIVGLTSGCFDLIHFGHVTYLARCKAQCDRLIVGVDSDEMVRDVKGLERPIIHEMERLEMVRNLVPVDVAFLMHSLADLQSIAEQFQVDKLFKHQGFTPSRRIFGMTTRTNLVTVPDVPGLVSTSEIIRRVREG